MHAQSGVATAEGEVTAGADSEDPAAEIVAEAIATGNFNKLDIVKLARQPVTAADVAGKSEIRLLLNGCFDIMHAGHYNALRQAKSLFAGFRVPVLLVAGIHRTETIIEQKGPPVPTALPSCTLRQALCVPLWAGLGDIHVGRCARRPC